MNGDHFLAKEKKKVKSFYLYEITQINQQVIYN